MFRYQGAGCLEGSNADSGSKRNGTIAAAESLLKGEAGFYKAQGGRVKTQRRASKAGCGIGGRGTAIRGGTRQLGSEAVSIKRRLEGRDAARHAATKARALRKISYLWAMPRITFLSIVEICYRDLGRTMCRGGPKVARPSSSARPNDAAPFASTPTGSPAFVATWRAASWFL